MNIKNKIHIHSKKILVPLTIGASLVGFLLTATPTFAGTGLSVAPNFPTTVTAGQTNIPVSLVITNNSTADEGNVTISSITLVPSCGDSVPGCTTPDPNVFSVSASGTGVGTSCGGDAFTIAQTNPTTGQVTFTRTGGPLVLAFGASCQIDFMVNALKVPTVDVNPIQSGVQTAQLGAANGTSAIGNPASGTGSDITTVNPASPTISTTPNPANAAVGNTLNDTATLSGGVTPTGSVTFKLFPPADTSCQGTPSYTDTDSSAPYATSPGFVANVPGIWHWTASYAGDANNNPVSSGCQDEPVTVVNPLVVEKTVNATYDRKWNWTIDKHADQTSLNLADGELFTVNYDVTVNASSVVQNAMVTGTITITNPAGNPTATITGVTDVLSIGGSATVTCSPNTFPQTLAGGASLTCTYTKNLGSANTDQTNTATVATSGTVPGNSSSAVTVDFTTPANVIDECINVSDTNGTHGGLPATVCAGVDTLPKTFNYSLTFGKDTTPTADVPLVCGPNTHVNTASFITNDTQATGSDSWTVNANVKCQLGCTLTQGYWKTHNDSFKGGAPTDSNWNNITPNKELSGFFTTANSYPVAGPNPNSLTWFLVFNTPPKGNAYYQLAHQWMAATLNVLNGASAPASVTSALASAQTFFTTYTPASFEALGKNSPVRTSVINWAGILGSYNEGLIGPGHCSEQNPQ